MTDEAARVERARRGDAAAFAELAEAHRDRVRRVLFRLAGAEALDDHEQEVFVAAWRALPAYRGEAAFSTFLLRIAARRARRWISRRRRPAPNEPLDGRADARAGPDGDAARGERAAAVRLAVESLRPALRAAFVLRYVEGLDGKTVAEVLGRPEGTVRSLLFAARRELSRRLGEEVIE